MMLLRVTLFVLWLFTVSLSLPLSNDRFSPKYLQNPLRKLFSTHSRSFSKFNRTSALAAQTTVRQKFRDAPSFLAGHGTSPGYAISPSLQHAYNRASDYATDISLLNSNPKPSANLSSGFSAAVRLESARILDVTNISLVDDTDDIDDYEYYGSMLFGSQRQMLQIDFDTGSADTWVPVSCSCGTVNSFVASDSNTYHDTEQYFSVTYGSGYVTGTLAQDTVTVGDLAVRNQFLGAVRALSSSFSDSPTDGLAGLAFGAIARSGKPTLFENLIPQLSAPMFSFYMTRTQPRGSEVSFGGIDQSKVKGNNISWVQVTSQTYWTVNMTGVVVNSLISTNISTIIDTGTSFIYIPDDIVAAVYNQIPGSAPAPDYGYGFYSFPCNTQASVSFVLGGTTLALDPRDLSIGEYSNDPSQCIGAIIAAGPIFGGEDMAILGDSFLKSYVSIFDYSHGARVGFVESIDE